MMQDQKKKKKNKQTTPEFIYKKLCIYSYMFKLQLLSIWYNTPIQKFFPLPKTVFELIDFSASTIFVLPLAHGHNISLWGLFHLEKQKKSLIAWGVWIGRCVNREGGASIGREVKLLLVKNCFTLSMVRGCVLANHPSWNRRMHSKSFPK